jgi:hypothetical protein
MRFIYDDGGRAAAGYQGSAGDCVCRAIAIAAEMPYEEIYQRLASGAGTERKTCGKSARNGVRVQRKWFKEFMMTLGFVWTPCMKIGSGCQVHLTDGELPMGRLVVSVSKHYTAVIDGVIRDTHNPEREIHWIEPDRGQELKSGYWRNPNGICHVSRRCVYGYWKLATESDGQ